ncbi:MAG: hypothetical protein NTY53_25710 [Kiritimatiellaeota bacterium]|nr:hypothetical protein [Kiritimatiellota bacterium]
MYMVINGTKTAAISTATAIKALATIVESACWWARSATRSTRRWLGVMNSWPIQFKAASTAMVNRTPRQTRTACLRCIGLPPAAQHDQGDGQGAAEQYQHDGLDTLEVCGEGKLLLQLGAAGLLVMNLGNELLDEGLFGRGTLATAAGKQQGGEQGE